MNLYKLFPIFILTLMFSCKSSNDKQITDKVEKEAIEIPYILEIEELKFDIYSGRQIKNIDKIEFMNTNDEGAAIYGYIIYVTRIKNLVASMDQDVNIICDIPLTYTVKGADGHYVERISHEEKKRLNNGLIDDKEKKYYKDKIGEIRYQLCPLVCD